MGVQTNERMQVRHSGVFVHAAIRILALGSSTSLTSEPPTTDHAAPA